MTNQIDYSTNDMIDINNRLFKQARDNLGKTSVPIKDLSEGKEKEITNLQIYGAELINNLKQINYTFEQIESYIFKPSKITRRNLKAVVEAGSKAKVEDILEVVKGSVDLPEYEGSFEDKYVNYDGLQSGVEYSKGELEDFQRKCEDELRKINFIIDDKKISEGVENIEDGSIELKGLGSYREFLEREYDKIEELLKKEEEIGTTEGVGAEETKEEGKLEEVKFGEPAEEEALPELLPPTIKDYVFPEKRRNLGEINKLLSGTSKTKMKTFKSKLENLGITGSLDSITTKADVQRVVDEYKGLTTGAGRRYLGGVKGVKKTSKRVKLSKKLKESLLPVEALEEEEEEEEEEEGEDSKKGEEYVEDDKVASDAVKIAKTAELLDKLLRKVVNSNQKSTIPSYVNRITDLTTNLVQFIGRTTSLYITRIKKNLNYLDEEQVKLIFSNIQKFKDNLAILKTYENKGGALIKDTLYNQIKLELEGLYSEINNSIRNYTKLKDSRIFGSSGAGMHPRLVGGYFINDRNSFIRQSLTKRYL